MNSDVEAEKLSSAVASFSVVIQTTRVFSFFSGVCPLILYLSVFCDYNSLISVFIVLGFRGDAQIHIVEDALQNVPYKCFFRLMFPN